MPISISVPVKLVGFWGFDSQKLNNRKFFRIKLRNCFILWIQLFWTSTSNCSAKSQFFSGKGKTCHLGIPTRVAVGQPFSLITAGPPLSPTWTSHWTINCRQTLLAWFPAVKVGGKRESVDTRTWQEVLHTCNSLKVSPKSTNMKYPKLLSESLWSKYVSIVALTV